MKCSQIRKMISPYVDNELAPDELKLFTSHIQGCPACKEELEKIRSIHQLFACAERFEAPLGFATRVMAHVEETEEAGLFSRIRRLFAIRPLFLRTLEVAFALVIMLIGVVSGNLLVGDRTSGNMTSGTQTVVRETFSLDLFQATPPDSIGGVYMRLAGD
jgi:anti-sigma factor RsiW